MTREITLIIVLIAWFILNFLNSLKDSIYEWYSLEFMFEVFKRSLITVIIDGILYIIFF